MEVLKHVSAGHDAASALGLGPRSAEEATLNLSLETAACAPAHELFTGVLYEAAGLTKVHPDGAGSVLDKHVVILSGLWGAVRATDLLPDHRLSMSTTLPGLGRMSTYWRQRLTPVLDGLAAGSLVVDCRSSAYAAAWQPTASSGTGQRFRLLRISVVRQRPDGSRQTVSHSAKHTRGLLTGALLRGIASGELAPEADADAVAELAASLEPVRDVEMSQPDRSGRCTLTLLVT